MGERPRPCWVVRIFCSYARPNVQLNVGSPWSKCAGISEQRSNRPRMQSCLRTCPAACSLERSSRATCISRILCCRIRLSDLRVRFGPEKNSRYSAVPLTGSSSRRYIKPTTSKVAQSSTHDGERTPRHRAWEFNWECWGADSFWNSPRPQSCERRSVLFGSATCESESG